MFYYFGYGSNMSVVSLRAKGVTPLGSEAATLDGWSICFDLPDFFRIEGGTGNVRRADDDTVHGVLHACRDDDLATLDRLEALGISYERIEATAITYGGRRARAFVYRGLPDILEEGGRPSARYKNLLLRGAQSARLDPRYIDRLGAISTIEPPDYPPFVAPQDATEQFTLESFKARPHVVALAGKVFDMSQARPRHGYLQELFSGKDASLLFLRRMASSDGTESFEQLRNDDLSDAQRRRLNDYLHEFAHEYRCVGSIAYRRDDRISSGDLLGAPVQPPTPQPVRVRSDRPSTPSEHVAASRLALTEAERANAELGHDNLGSLSEQHGFMPAKPPAARLTSSAHAAWDELAEGLPRLYRDLQVRKRLRELPVLSAKPEDLPDHDLLRAAQVLAMLSHAYWYVETAPPKALPEGLARPWAQVRERLGRGPAVLSYLDLIVYNWRLLDPHRPDPMRLDNMRLLVPTVDNREEHVFYLTQTEILAHCNPVIGSAVRAQEAVLREDHEALEFELETIISCFRRVLGESLLQINPSTASESYVDPVVWAKTVAPFAVPFEQGVQGPSGTSSPIFNTLDVFLRRKSYKTFLGEEIKALRDVYPPHWRRYLAALHAVDVPGYVRRTADPNLVGLLNEAVETYAGENGFLGRHRMKVYGYLELAFKVGRSITIGGFSGMFQDRTWDRVDDELEASRVERLERYPQRAYEARVVSVGPADPKAPEGVRHVVLDVSGTGIRYEPGDRCGVLPENREPLVDQTLKALGATGDEVVPLTDEWRASVRLRSGYREAEQLTVREVLRFGRIRPVLPRLAEALHAATQSQALLARIHERSTEDWEMWELVEQLRADGFDPRSIWEGDHADRLCRVVPPETFRLYSISSVMSAATSGARREIHLTVGRIRYDAPDGGQPRYGTASNFLAEAAGREEPISVVIFHPPRFSLPRDPQRPIVMIAGGTGLSPFRAFLTERMRQRRAGPTHLFLGLRSRAYLEMYREELAGPLADGRLQLRAAFSRDDVVPRFVPDGEGGGTFAYEPAAPQRIEGVLRDEAEVLWDQLRSEREGGRGGYVYVCGRSGFAKTALDTLEEVVSVEQSGSEGQRDAKARRFIERLLGERRLMTDIFTDALAVEEPAQSYPVSELALRNDDEHGYWLAIEGLVYDLTAFIRQHPGGDRVLQGYCGMDASEGYRRSHQGRSEIAAMLKMYEVGSLQRLDFGGRTGVIDADGRPQKVTFTALHRLWVKALFLVVEMQNALRADQSLQVAAAIGRSGTGSSERNAYKLQRALETHDRFVAAYVYGLGGEPFEQLWRLTAGLLAPQRPVDELSATLHDIFASPAARAITVLVDELRDDLDALILDGDEEARVGLVGACAILEREDARLLAELKDTLRAGVSVFETLEAGVADHGYPLVETALRLAAGFEEYFARIAQRLQEHGCSVRMSRLPPAPAPPDSLERQRTVLLSESLWVMEENVERHFVMLRRTAEEISSLEELVDQNDKVIALIRKEHEEGFGLVCDFREVQGRNDPAFEGAMKRLRGQLTTRFPRVAVLLSSEAGVLQVNRLQRNEGGGTFATRSETAAIRFAMVSDK